jgi:16S rRNA (guanine966-N2)-methyltransferase
MSASTPGEVRIIGGRWKRTPLPVADRPGLRPTPGRVRETLFNWLGQDLAGWRVLDAYAGSGALGLEAASRGASAVTLLEQDPKLVQTLRQTVQKLQAGMVEVHRADALAWMARSHHEFDLILLDPPFADGVFDAALRAASHRLARGGLIYLECGQPPAELPAGLHAWRQGRAGQVHYLLYREEPAN